MKLKAHAKVNLTLKIGPKLKSGLHKIESVMHPIELHDTLSFDKISEDKITIESNNESIRNKENLVYQAAHLLKKTYNVPAGVQMYIN